jgi:signal transduction histidine kinase/ligand-binding sensor domain-containing protein
MRIAWAASDVRRGFSLLVMLLLCADVGLAQPAPVPLRHEVLSTWTTEQGLPQDFISAIAQTPDGFLWVGTYGGLARFDGLNFRTFAFDASSALRGYITSLVVDREGRLWVGTPAGLFVYRGRSFVPVFETSAPGQPIDVLQLVVCNDRGVWVRTKTALLHAVDERATADFLGVAGGDVTDLCAGDGDRLWVLAHDRVVVQRGQKVEGDYPLAAGKMLYRAPDGRIFAGDGHHLFLFSGNGFLRQAKSGVGEFVGLLLDRSGQLWMASGGLEGISRLAAGKIEKLDKSAGLMSNDVRELLQDRDGDIWIGTIAGLQRLHVGTFTSFTERDGLAPGRNQFDAIFEDAHRTIWAGTLQEGIAELRGDRWTVFGKGQGVRAGQVRGFADDAEMPVFAMSDYGIFAWSGERFRKLPGIPEGYPTTPLRTDDGSLWFSVSRKGVFRWKDGKATAYGSAEGMTATNVWTLVAGADGDLWAGDTNGVSRWHDGRWARLPLPVRSVFSIVLETDGSLLLGTNAGLVFHGEGSRHGVEWSLTQLDGLPSNSVFAMAQDGLGDIWLATAGGICRVPHGQVEALNSGAAKHVNPEVYTQADGLISRSLLPMGQVTALRAHDGRLWFATTFGPSVASPVAAEERPPDAQLDNVSVDDHRMVSDRVTVAPGRHRLAFNFTAPEFSAAEQIRFRYRLIGWETDWVDAGTSRQASYAGLPPGDYSFEVQALGRTGAAGSVSRTIALRLEPFFWQTRWFLLVMIAICVGFVIEVTRRRTQARVEAQSLRFQERATERERIASQIHDTFIQDLIGTALQLELVGLQLEEDPDVARSSLRNLGARLRGIIARSRDIISNLHSMAAPEEGLVGLLRHTESEFRLSELPSFGVICESDELEVPPFVRDEVYRICREAVANAFRHALARSVVVWVSFEEDRLEIRITDDGTGMTDEMQLNGRPGHFGLSGMRAHARRIGAELNVESECGKGTTVMLRLDLRQGAAGRIKSVGRMFRRRIRAYTVTGERFEDAARTGNGRRRSE